MNKVINMLCCWLEDPEGPAFRAHLARVADYLWVAEDGMKMQGYNGSQLWDTAFAMQAALSSGLACEYPGVLRSAYAYLDASQVREDCAPPLRAFYRHISKGAWPFSTRDHGWPISDCTAEGLKAALLTLSAEEAAAARGEGEAEAAAEAVGSAALPFCGWRLERYEEAAATVTTGRRSRDLLVRADGSEALALSGWHDGHSWRYVASPLAIALVGEQASRFRGERLTRAEAAAYLDSCVAASRAGGAGAASVEAASAAQPMQSDDDSAGESAAASVRIGERARKRKRFDD